MSYLHFVASEETVETIPMAARRPPRAVFMAFGTNGDVHPLVAVAAALASDQCQYQVVIITHAAHENLIVNLATQNVSLIPISTPPVISGIKDHWKSGTVESSSRENFIGKEHRKKCLTAMQKVFGDGPTTDGDFVVINFFALEGWHLAEFFRVRCVVAAPYVVPYSAPSSFEHRFETELPLLYSYLQEAPVGKVCWKDVIHWMWPLFTEEWGSWRSEFLSLSPCPFTDPVTGLPMWHDREQSPLLLYGFSKEVVECPAYWPPSVHVCGFWFLPLEWQFECYKCRELSAAYRSTQLDKKDGLCVAHAGLQHFLEISGSDSWSPIFIGLSSSGSMGFLQNPQAFLRVIRGVLENTDYRVLLFTANYEPLIDAIQAINTETFGFQQSTKSSCNDGTLLFGGRLFCFSGTVQYRWLFQRCQVVVHHGGSGSTAAALYAGTPQIVCPFILDQFYWAEKMTWLGVAPPPLKRSELLPDGDDEASIQNAAISLSNAIKEALSPEVRARAFELAARISAEDGIGEALKVLKQHIIFQSKHEE
ncbi:sterol 3-beta-glucosyltransferase UGT80A2 isoform X1 [Aristolochia californica]|uniref:sterol 3-beta-glucosyltransferase UGT80A2 isoform X1 n=1 Tax=Aristolochia californica TaxID=171875 RepID=UPI0035E01976